LKEIPLIGLKYLMVVGNATIEKPKKQWDEEERRRV